MKKSDRFECDYDDGSLVLYELSVDELSTVKAMTEFKNVTKAQIKKLKPLLRSKKIYAQITVDLDTGKENKEFSALFISVKSNKAGNKIEDILHLRFDDAEEHKPYYYFESEGYRPGLTMFCETCNHKGPMAIGRFGYGLEMKRSGCSISNEIELIKRVLLDKEDCNGMCEYKKHDKMKKGVSFELSHEYQKYVEYTIFCNLCGCRDKGHVALTEYIELMKWARTQKKAKKGFPFRRFDCIACQLGNEKVRNNCEDFAKWCVGECYRQQNKPE